MHVEHHPFEIAKGSLEVLNRFLGILGVPFIQFALQGAGCLSLRVTSS